MTLAGSDSPIDPARRDWRPLKPRATRRPPVIANPVLEPFWSGTRVLAHFVARPETDEPAWVELVDEKGREATERAPSAAAALRDSIMALEAVIDGVLSSQPSAGGEGSAMIPEARVTGLSLFIPRSADIEYKRVGQPASQEIAFVAVDLLSVDGLPLLDLPLLERKRQLESLLLQGPLVRVSPIARPPVRPWLNSWKSAGFRGLMMKGANSRYRPGDQTVEWTIVDAMR